MKKTIIFLAITVVILGWVYLLKWEKMSPGIQEGDVVTISYKATLPDGRIFANSNEEVITIGENNIPGLDAKLIGQKSGDIVATTIPASQGYGMFYDTNKLQRMPVYTLTQAGITPEQWKFILLGWTRYYIHTIENDIVTLDTNPEHTRQDLNYDVQILGRDKQ